MTNHKIDEKASLNVETLLLSSKLISIAGLIWGIMYIGFGMYFSSIFPFSYTIIMTLIIILYQKGLINSNKLLFFDLFLILILPAFLQWSVGTFNSSGVVVLWSILAPTGSLLFQNSEKAMKWFFAFLFVIMILVVYEIFLYKEIVYSADKALIFSVMNITAISSILFYSLSFFVKQSNKKEVLINNLLDIESKARAELKIKADNLNSSVIEKEIMLKEIHHRVKNNLQVITSLLSLQNTFINENKLKAIFQKSQNRINSMALVHEMLYQTENLSKINYGNYCTKLISKTIELMTGNNNKIEFDIQAKDIFLNIDTSIPLGLIINEIITNSLKYGFEDGSGKISIEIAKKEAGKFKMKIGDDGKGFSYHNSYRNTKTLGLKLIHKLSKQLNGLIEMDNSKKGTYYIFNFEEI